MVFEEFFGSEIQRGKETLPTSTLEGKTVLIYFSAHWCGPCRMFTPQLSAFYTKLKEARQDFDLVFVSSDRDQAAFDEYYGEMPWLALPYSKRDLKEKLSKKYKVQGIPTLLVIDKDGKVITNNGRAAVSKDPEGADFPWIPPTLPELLGNTFLGHDNKETQVELKGKIFGIYFSAHWCPPCKRFTPILAEKYKELKAQGKDLEIVFVSSDRDQAAFDEYFHEMPWIAVPFSDSKRRTGLGEHFEVEGIPSLVILDTDLSVITTNGVSAVFQNLPYPFRPPPLSELTPETASEINESPALVVFSENVEETSQFLKPIAEEYVNAKKGIIFYVAGDSEMVPSIRQFANLKPENKLVILDIPGQAKFLSDASQISGETVRAFVDGYLAQTLTSAPIRS